MTKLGKFIVAGLAMALVAACGGRETHFMTDKAYREAVHADYEARMAANDSALARVVALPGDELSPTEREALAWTRCGRRSASGRRWAGRCRSASSATSCCPSA